MFEEFFTKHNIPTPPTAINHNDFTRWGGRNNNRYSSKLIGDGIYVKDFITDLDETWFPNNNTSLSPEEVQNRKNCYYQG